MGQGKRDCVTDPKLWNMLLQSRKNNCLPLLFHLCRQHYKFD
ncbi:MAG: hypothetical protein JWQ08_120, partial [Deinococcus sp.]|nr:hypothetical protein [Deinococcus sp.]